jgi:hypothetical protein
VRLVNAALAMATAAKPLASQFTAAAFPANFVQQLTDAANALKAVIDTRRRKVADRGNATSAVEQALREARAAWYMIAAAVSRLVPRDSSLYDEWLAVRRVVNVAARPRKAGAAVAGSIAPVEAQAAAA